jgi:hypothetical protein
MKESDLNDMRAWVVAEIELSLVKAFYLSKGGMKDIEKEKILADAAFHKLKQNLVERRLL